MSSDQCYKKKEKVWTLCSRDKLKLGSLLAFPRNAVHANTEACLTLTWTEPNVHSVFDSPLKPVKA